MAETEQFEQFMRNYQNMVFSTAVRLLGNEAEAQDVAQEVFLKAYARFAELSVSPTAGGWLKTVTTNLCLNHLTRYRARWRFFSDVFTNSEGEEQEMDLPAPGNFLDDLDSVDTRDLIEKALEKLPVSQRVPLVLFHFEDKSYEEIAAALKISLSKVKIDIFRGREALKKKLRLDNEDWPDSTPTATASAAPKEASRAGGSARILASQLPVTM